MANKVTMGNYYVTCESLYHLLGGKNAGWTPHTIRHEGTVHWYLVKDARNTLASDWVIDPTVSQFKTKPDYTKGRGRGFLTRKPSKRARAMMRLMVWQGDL